MTGTTGRAGLVAAAALLALLGGCTSTVDGRATAAAPPAAPTSAEPIDEDPVDEEPVDEDPVDEDPVDEPDDEGPTSEPVWDAGSITAALEAYADDEAEDWAAIEPEGVVQVPCGGEGAHGVSPEAVATVGGGAERGASAQVFAGPEAASRELTRLEDLLLACEGPYDYISRGTGEVLTRCAAPVVAAGAPVLQYVEECEISAGQTYDYAVFRTGNAVVALSAQSGGGLFDALPDLLDAFSADA
ncbi:hypothetical protein [Blastococcus sp. SYSU D00820]